MLAVMLSAVLMAAPAVASRLDNISGSFSSASHVNYTPVRLLLFAFSAVFFSIGTWACMKRKKQGTPLSGLVGILVVATSYLVSALSLYSLFQ
jgi:hypothetical protein